MCKRVFSVGCFGPGFDSMSPASYASHAAGLHDWFPPKNGGLGLRRGRIRWIQFAQSLLTVAHQPRAGCIRLVQPENVNNSITTRDPPKKRMKETLFTRHRSTVEPMMIVKDRKATLQAIHTMAVKQDV